MGKAVVQEPSDQSSQALRQPDLPRDPTTREFLFVQVQTDDGITGWGEITPFPKLVGNRAMHGFVKEIAALVIGEDPSDIEYLWHKMFRSPARRGSRIRR